MFYIFLEKNVISICFVDRGTQITKISDFRANM